MSFNQFDSRDFLTDCSFEFSSKDVLSAKEFSNRWSHLIELVRENIPALSRTNVNEVALALSTVSALASRSRNGDLALDWLTAQDGVLGSKFLGLLRTHPDIVDAIKTLQLQHICNLDDPHSVLMQLIAMLEGRAKHGVFYTPRPLASFVAGQGLEQLSKSRTQIRDIKILEPSSGSGIFVSALISELIDSNTDLQLCSILGNLVCLDISPGALAVSQFLIAKDLFCHNVELSTASFPTFCAGDTLSATVDPIYSQLEMEVPNFYELARERTYQLVIGNPPFGSLVDTTDSWMADLLHGRVDDEGGRRSYFQINDEELGERKSWLHDNYVKFVRYAHWQSERTEFGCVAFVLNSGFVSNISFRAMRHHLCDTFDVLEITDLGGDLRNSRDLHDENVFEIETGIATLVGSRSTCGSVSKRHSYVKLRGGREAKLNWCRDPDRGDTTFDADDLRLETTSIDIAPPNYRFDVRPTRTSIEFENGWSVEDLFFRKWSVPVTARDHLVIDWSPQALIEKISNFLDPQASDQSIRETFFPRPRSSRYPRGDSRSWKLENVRRELPRHDWHSWIRPCVYRPFDQRYVLWNPLMIDWPRNDLAEVLDVPGNECLIGRRQAPFKNDYSYFWSTRMLPIDGVLRSDNRGNEYCYPLLQLENGTPVSNINPRIILELEQRWCQSVTPESVFYLTQAVFHSTEYRSRYHRSLCEQFPRVFFPRSFHLAKKLVELGRDIVALQSQNLTCETNSDTESYREDPCSEGLSGRVRFEAGQVLVNDHTLGEVAEPVWHFGIGSHQLIKKYCAYRLQDRMTRGLSESIKQLSSQIRRHAELTVKLDKTIADDGGFENTFNLTGEANAISNESSSSTVHVPRR